MSLKNEQRFYSALKDTFIGEKVEGKSGYVNLMKIRNEYFNKIKPFIEKEINETITDQSARAELFEKLYTFFESYFSDTGTPFFSKTQLHKNLYEKVYTERDDVSLFWKTQKLFYVKSEANYTSLEIEFDNYKFVFDASEIEHKKANEKKDLKFYLTDLIDNTFTFKIRYKAQINYERLRKYLEINEPDKIRKYLVKNFDSIDQPNINIIYNSLDRSNLKPTFIEKNLLIENNNDIIQSVSVEFAISDLKNLEHYFSKNNIIVDIDIVKKAFFIYRKQNKIDYFIHKDAENFLKEQFDIYLLNYLFGDSGLESEWKQDRINQIQNVKRIAHKVIEYIARFEDELKAIWNKPKFVRNSNYVITIGRLEGDINLVERIINHKGFKKQIEEWKILNEEWSDDNKGFKNEWKEFENASKVKKKDILISTKTGKILNPKYRYLPIDTRYFGELKFNILEHFDNLDEEIDGVLIKSDNYHALNSLLPLYRAQFDLIYIDPPFNTGSDFLYIDKYQDSTWLTLMHDRISIAHHYLNKSANFFMQIDYNANYLGRFLLNSIFGETNFLNEIVWYYYNKLHDSRKKKLPRAHDIIFRYSVSPGKQIHNPIYEKREKPIKKLKYVKVNGKIKNVIGEDGKAITYVSKERTVDDVWRIRCLQPANINEWQHFDTQKPEDFMKQILSLSIKPSNLVMDFFAGTATTLAVAHKMGNRWLGIEMGDHFENKCLPRMKKVLIGDGGGISKDKDIKWEGGGFFKYYELEQFEETLAIAKYNPKENDLTNINFQKDEKLLDAILIDHENERVKIHFENLFPDVDIAETLSNLIGKKIKKLNKEWVIFDDGMKIKYDEMTYEKYPFVKPLIWWKSR